MQFKYFDAHTHVQFPAFDMDREGVMKRAFDAGVGMINIGTSEGTSESAVKLAHEYGEGVYAVVGMHPTHAGPSFHDVEELGNNDVAQHISRHGEEFDYGFYKNLACDPKVVGIGECGLDYYRLEGDTEEVRQLQRDAFVAHLQLAHEVKKPLMIHCRSAFGDLLKLLNLHVPLLNEGNPGIIHFFSGNSDEAQHLLKLGFSFTFGGVVTFARDYDEVIRAIPVERLLTETDAPYVAPAPYRGKRNEPMYVIEVAKKLDEIKEVELDYLARIIVENTQRIFSLPG